jgi:hypothetical protein
MERTFCDSFSISSVSILTVVEGEDSIEKLGCLSQLLSASEESSVCDLSVATYRRVAFCRACLFTAFDPSNIILPLFENSILFNVSSSIRLSVGMGIVIGVYSSVGLLSALLLFLLRGLLHRDPPALEDFESLFRRLSSPERGDIGMGAKLTELAIELFASKSIFSQTSFSLSSSVLPAKLSSLGFELVVVASPLSLFQSSSPDRPLFGLRSAGCVSVGGTRGGDLITAIGGFAGVVSSYLRASIPLSFRVADEVKVGTRCEFLLNLLLLRRTLLKDRELVNDVPRSDSDSFSLSRREEVVGDTGAILHDSREVELRIKLWYVYYATFALAPRL